MPKSKDECAVCSPQSNFAKIILSGTDTLTPSFDKTITIEELCKDSKDFPKAFVKMLESNPEIELRILLRVIEYCRVRGWLRSAALQWQMVDPYLWLVERPIWNELTPNNRYILRLFQSMNRVDSVDNFFRYRGPTDDYTGDKSRSCRNLCIHNLVKSKGYSLLLSGKTLLSPQSLYSNC